MDLNEKLSVYRQIIETVLFPYASIQYTNGEIQNEALFDRQRDHYAIVSVGWQEGRRVYHSLIHIDIVNSKVYIQRDGTEDGIGYELEAAGIPKSDIVPAFHPITVRPYTGYAVV